MAPPICGGQRRCRSPCPRALAPIFSKQNVLGETIAWAVPCISGRGRRIPANLFGALVATNEEPHKIVFVAKKSGRGFCQTIDLEGLTIAHEPQFLSENLVILPTAGRGPKYCFMFTRSRGALVEQIAEYFAPASELTARGGRDVGARAGRARLDRAHRGTGRFSDTSDCSPSTRRR